MRKLVRALHALEKLSQRLKIDNTARWAMRREASLMNEMMRVRRNVWNSSVISESERWSLGGVSMELFNVIRWL